MTRTVLEQIADLDAQREKLISEGLKSAKEQVESALAELNALGLTQYVLTLKVSGGTGVKRAPIGGPCPVCSYLTDPPHDGRKHRSQETNAPFTDAELGMMHMTKV